MGGGQVRRSLAAPRNEDKWRGKTRINMQGGMQDDAGEDNVDDSDRRRDDDNDDEDGYARQGQEKK